MDRRIFLKSTLSLPFVHPMQTVLANGRESGSMVGDSPPFVHLRVHTEYSLCDGIVRVPDLMRRVSSAAMPAVALTDQSNLFGVVEFYKEAQAAGIKPVIGVDAWIRETGQHAIPSRITLLCQSLVGYRRLTQLVSKSFLEGQRGGPPLLEHAWLDCGLEGLIVLSGAAEGNIGRGLARGRHDEAARYLDKWLALCGDRFYLEVTRTGRPGEQAYAEAALDLADARGVAAVATNDVRFLARTDFEAHEARVCIHDGTLLADPNRLRRYSPEQYLKSPAEMAELFADLPALLQNSVEIATRCSLDFKLGASMLPAYPLPAGRNTDSHLRVEAGNGLAARLPREEPRSGAVPLATPYLERLDLELSVICKMGIADYFLIVADIIRWARAHGVPVGPGRGAVAGSLVAYALGITDVDPIEHDLLFERFLNPERTSRPDFDIDIGMEGRDTVIDYVAAKYGQERVSQLITYGTLAARAAVRDVGRVLGYQYGYVDQIAMLIPFEIGITLDKALNKNEEFRRRYDKELDVRKFIDLARALEGLPRTVGTHAGSVVIAPSALTDFTSLYCDNVSSAPVIQFDKDDANAVGLPKFNVLGLRTLTIIDSAVREINVRRARSGDKPLRLTALRLDDELTYELIKNGDTSGIFQLQSGGMRELIRRLQPERFGDLVALPVLIRPGPLELGMVEDFIDRKYDPSGQAFAQVPVDLRPVLASTYGMILYQEQVMQVAHTLAGYTLNEADLFWRALAKGDSKEIASNRAHFLCQAINRGVPEQKAIKVLDWLGKIARHTISKSHATAYAFLTYQTAWLKARYPADFMAAVKRDAGA